MPDAPRITVDAATFSASTLATPSTTYTLPVISGEITQREGQTPLYQGSIVLPYDATLWGVNPLYRGSGSFGPLCSLTLTRKGPAGNTIMTRDLYLTVRQKSRSRARETMEFRVASRDALALDSEILNGLGTQTVHNQISSILRSVQHLEDVLVVADADIGAGDVNGLDLFDEGTSAWDTAQGSADMCGGIIYPQGSYFQISEYIHGVFERVWNAFDPAGFDYYEPLDPPEYDYTRDAGYADGTFLRWSWTDANGADRSRTGLYMTGGTSRVQRIERRGAPPAGSTQFARDLAARRMTERAIRRGSRIRLRLPFMPNVSVADKFTIPSDANASVSQTITVQEVVHSIGAATTTVIGA